MATFYTVDRNMTLAPGSMIAPDFELTGHRICTVAGLYDEAAMTDHLRQFFPSGIAAHGKRYLLDQSLIFPTTSGFPPLVPMSPIIELVFELVRRYEFPDSPSRMTSLFALWSMEDAQRLRAEFGVPGAPIFRLECDSAFRADMRLLHLGAATLGSWLQAQNYWRGKSSAVPLWEALLTAPVNICEKVA